MILYNLENGLFVGGKKELCCVLERSVRRQHGEFLRAPDLDTENKLRWFKPEGLGRGATLSQLGVFRTQFRMVGEQSFNRWRKP